ncbi:MAG TPA: DUF4255 domain-containing protein, partial [Chloroflexaceae bacterium]|nr:DUF4255 domain-containing protein [Chloroflexaceae bacterium]
MLKALDRTLKNLLREGLELGDQELTFAAPDDVFGAGAKGLNLFLYDLRENNELRANDWETVEVAGRAMKRRAPRRVDCSYLITAWAADVEDQHSLLGDAMLALLRERPIPARHIPEDARFAREPLPTSVLQPANLQSIGEFWQAMGNRPRAALNLTVTIAVEIFDPVPVTLPERRELGTGQVQGGAGARETIEQTRESVVR